VAASNQTDPEVIRNSLTREVTNDASVISSQIFRGPALDTSHVTNQQLDDHYRQAFQANDRQFLMDEATRDPVQFMASMDRLGVTMPPDKPLPPNQPLPPGARPNVSLPKPSESALQQQFSTPQEVPPPQPAAPVAPPPVAPLPGGGLTAPVTVGPPAPMPGPPMAPTGPTPLHQQQATQYVPQAQN
jgi:hypothetical protein